MRNAESIHRYPVLKLLVWMGLILALAACQAVPGPKSGATATVPATTAELPTTAPSATAEQPTATLPEPTQAATQATLPQMLHEVSITYPSRLIWSMDGLRLAVIHEGGVTVLDAETLDTLASRAFTAPAAALDFSPDGKTIAYTSDGKTIELVDIFSGQPSQTITPGNVFQRAVFSPDGKLLAVDSMDQMAYTLWDVSTGQKGSVLSGFVTAAPIYAGDFSASGNKFIWHARGTIQVMDIASGALGTSIGHEDFISGFALKPDDSLLATAAGGTFSNQFTALIYLWKPQTGEQIAVYPQDKFASV
ncbi:hypothetical protein FDZ74_07000, partial [bacterium]